MLTGKIAAVTASTKGIGLATANKLLSEGSFVYISSRKQDNVDKVVAELSQKYPDKVFGSVCHVSNKKDRQNLFDKIKYDQGKLDILVSNAAVKKKFDW